MKRKTSKNLNKRSYLKKLNMSFCFFMIFLINHATAGESVIINHSNWDPSGCEIALFDSVRTDKIMFGHQSIGYNIIDGLTMLSAEDADRFELNIIDNPDNLKGTGFGHWENGRNSYPHGKIDSFAAKMRSPDSNGKVWAEVCDIAFFKFCYIDFNSLSLDIDSLFNHYIATMDSLRMDFPNCKFVYVTAPLSALKFSSDKLRNMNRHAFNQKLREYIENAKSYLFDLADLEAYDENGNYQFFENQGTSYPMMWFDSDDPENSGWSSDGGHLNSKGKRYIASALWRLLVTMHSNLTSVNPEQSFNGYEIGKPFELLQNHPNPFNPVTQIFFSLSYPNIVSIKVYNLSGKEISTLMHEYKEPGKYSVRFNGSRNSSGLYFYNLKVGNTSETKKMLLIK